jgi:hypothetical protein
MSDNGAAKNDKEKMDLSLIPKVALEAAAYAFMIGEKKYGRYNFYKGHQASQLVAAMMRHATAWMEGEERDPVDGQLHLGSVIATAAMPLQQQKLGTLKDNRYVKEEVSTKVENKPLVHPMEDTSIIVENKNVKNELHISKSGYTWKKEPEGYRDMTTNILWYYHTDLTEYTYDEAVAKYGDRLPTKEEFEEAENHGIREVMTDFKGKFFWSASLVSSNRNFACYFFSDLGDVYVNVRNFAGGVRCVGR